MSVDFHAAADDGRIGRKASPPEAFAQHEHSVATGLLILVGQKRTPEDGVDAEDVEEICRGDLPEDPLQLFVDAQAGRRNLRRNDAREDILLFLDIPHIGQ